MGSGGIRARALDFARSHEHAAIFNHSVRTHFHALTASTHLGCTDFDPDELHVAAILHDIGTAPGFDGPQRFEVEGADAAAEFLSNEGHSAAAQRRVWQAIALHTSPGIAERMGTLERLLRFGVVADFGGPTFATAAEVRELEQRYPRQAIEKVLGDTVVSQAVAEPSKAPASSWPHDLLRAYQADPGYQGVNPAF